MKWQDIKTADKNGDDYNNYILGFDGHEKRVIRWCTDYPYTDGVWSYGEVPTDYISDQLTFSPTHWQELPDDPD